MSAASVISNFAGHEISGCIQAAYQIAPANHRGRSPFHPFRNYNAALALNRSLSRRALSFGVSCGMSGATIFPELEADVLFDVVPPAECVRTSGKHQSVQCFLVAGDVRLKVMFTASGGDLFQSALTRRQAFTVSSGAVLPRSIFGVAILSSFGQSHASVVGSFWRLTSLTRTFYDA